MALAGYYLELFGALQLLESHMVCNVLNLLQCRLLRLEKRFNMVEA